VTGVSENGMGEGEVVAFLENGVSVIATSIDLKLIEYLKEKAPKYEKHGASIVRHQLDVTSPQSIAAAVDRLRHITGGRLDFLMSTVLARLVCE
jgi:1-acylglycerone phosphate reductase